MLGTFQLCYTQLFTILNAVARLIMDPLCDAGASRVATTVPMWFESAPKDYKYPWNKLTLPSTKDAEVSDKFF